jgi:hypothetical protein
MRKARNLGTERASKIGRDRQKSLEGDAHRRGAGERRGFAAERSGTCPVGRASRKAQTDFAAGTLSNRDLIIILVAIAALILIIVAVR